MGHDVPVRRSFGVAWVEGVGESSRPGDEAEPMFVGFKGPAKDIREGFGEYAADGWREVPSAHGVLLVDADINLAFVGGIL